MHKDVERLKLESELADIEQESSRLKADQSISAGLRVAREALCEHLRQKKLLEIELHDLNGTIGKLDAEYEYSKTPGAQKVWHDREMQRLAGSALGGGSYFRQGGSQDSGPEVEALRKLRKAQADYCINKAQLDELCTRDLDFENLVAEKKREQTPTTGLHQLQTKQNHSAGLVCEVKEESRPGPDQTPAISDELAETRAEGRAHYVGKIFKELTVLKNRGVVAGDLLDLQRQYPTYDSIHFAVEHQHIRKMLESISDRKRVVSLAFDIAALKFERARPTIVTDWKRHKPAEFRQKRDRPRGPKTLPSRKH